MLACFAGEVDWAWFFYEKYEHLLSDDNEKKKISRPTLKYYSKEYKEAIFEFSRISFNTFQFQLTAKGLIIRSYIEMSITENTETILSHCKAFENLLRRRQSEMSQQIFNIRMNQILLVKRIVLQKSSKTKLLADLEEINVVDRNWVRNQILRLPSD